MTRRVLAAAFFCGLVFAFGLGISGMTQPSKVVGFLDLFGGAWDPSLGLVMAGAIAVHAPLGFLIRRRRGSPAPINGCDPDDARDSGRFSPVVLPRDDELAEVRAAHLPNGRIGSVIAGAAIFGAGWGLGGYCPGPALVSLVSLAPGVLLFVAAMLVGMLLFEMGSQRKRAWRSARAPYGRGTVHS